MFENGLPESYAHIPNVEAMRGMGRRLYDDPRDKAFPMAVPRTPAKLSRHWNIREVLDQGATPHCVAYSWIGLLRCGPVKQAAGLIPDAEKLYALAQEADEWPGTDYDGTSVRAGAKVLRGLGFLHTYKWATTARTVAIWVIENGPVVLGTTWLDGMNTPDRDGFMHADGDPYGGHAYLACGADLERECPDGSKGAVRILNSWGAGWGEKGRAWISLLDLDALLRDWGEACSAAEILKI